MGNAPESKGSWEAIVYCPDQLDTTVFKSLWTRYSSWASWHHLGLEH
jgi:hypothetical protein